MKHQREIVIRPGGDAVEAALCEAYPVALQSMAEVEDRVLEQRGFRKGFAAALATPCPAPPAHKLNGDQTVAVSTEVFINPDMTTCPRGVKVQLEGAGGVLMYGTYDGRNPFFVGWAPVPRRRPK